MNNIIEIIISTIISTGIIAGVINYWFDKKLRTHEIKLKKYIKLIEELAKLMGSEANWNELRPLLNEALLFASNNVVKEILEFNNLYKEKSKNVKNNKFQMTNKDIQPLVIAIRKDLYLKSKSIKENGLKFFIKENQHETKK